MIDEGSREHPERFRTTRWSRIVAVRGGDSARAREALESLCRDYWYPLYAFVRRKGYDDASAEDLVQGFFARLLEKKDLATLDRRKGRFRSFLLAACTHYLANQAERARAQKRGGGRAMLSLDPDDARARYAREPAHELTAERLYERRWALTVLERVLAQLEGEMAKAGKLRQFSALRSALLGDGGRAGYTAIAAELGLSEEAARAAATRLRRRYRELLRQEVAGTIGDPSEVDDEVSILLNALAV